jgi:hypothetical protein
LSLFSNGINFLNTIPEPKTEENFLIPILQNAKENIIEPVKILSDKIEKIEQKDKPKFTDEQFEILDKYLDGIFSADEVKSKYEFDYIQFYYKKAKDLDEKGTIKDFAGFLYTSLIEDKYDFYQSKEKKRQQEERKIAKEKLDIAIPLDIFIGKYYFLFS